MQNVLGQFLANFWAVTLHIRCNAPWEAGEKFVMVVRQSRKARLASTVQVAVNFSSRNQHAPKTGKLPQHLSADESADCFLANPQLGCTAFYVESLAFGNCYRVHKFNFHRQQHTTHRDSFGVASAQTFRTTRTRRRLYQEFKQTRLPWRYGERRSTERLISRRSIRP